MQLTPQPITGAFSLPNAPVMQVIEGTPQPFGFKESLANLASFYFMSEERKELLKREAEIQRLKATQGERILNTEGAKLLGSGIAIVGLALVIYALRS